MNYEKIISGIMLTVVSAIIIAGTFSALNEGIKKSEKNECVKWVEQSQEYQKWYSTDWQKKQCETYGIALK